MAGKAVITLSTGLEDPEKVTVAFLVADGAAESGRPTLVCPVCFNARQLDQGGLMPHAELADSVQPWEWISDEGATTFSY
jgi:hypothetical protein